MVDEHVADAGDWAALFTDLSRFCWGCGRPTHEQVCPDCDSPAATPAPGPVPPPPLGRWATVRRGVFSRSGIVASEDADTLTVVSAAGKADVVPQRKARVSGGTSYLDRVRSPVGAVAAASQGVTVTPRQRDALIGHAVALVDGDPLATRGLAADCIALGLSSLLDQLGFSASERTWWLALYAFARDRHAQGVGRLLELPPGRYPLQLALWTRAVAQAAIPHDRLNEVREALGQLRGHSSVADVAAVVVLRALDGGTGDLLCTDLVAAARPLITDPAASTAWAQAARWARGEEGDLTAARLLGARTNPGRLGPEPSVIDAAPAEVVDDLVDAGAIPAVWLDRVDELVHRERVTARVDIARLDDDALARVGADDERARRAILSRRSIPRDVDGDVRARYAPLAAACNGDDDALLAIADAAGLDVVALRQAMVEPSSVPPDGVLADTSIAAELARRSTLTGADLDPARLSDPQRRYVALALLWRTKEALHTWDWDGAFDVVRRCLRVAKREDQRDEALNLLAAAHWQLGRDDAAIQALGVALEGDYTESLQANMAVVAAELEPRTAATHLSRLVVEAPNLQLRVSAARRAILIWGHDTEPWAGESDRLPLEIAEALRSLVVEPIGEDDFRELVQLLAEHDTAWLAQPGSLDRSPHRRSPEARVWVARATGIDTFVKVLAEVLRAEPLPWAERLRDDLVGAAIAALVKADLSLEITLFAMLLLTENLPMPRSQELLLKALAARGAALTVNLESGEPSVIFVEWLESAAGDVDHMPPDHRTTATLAIAMGFEALGHAYASSRERHLPQLAELSATLTSQLALVPAFRINQYALSQVTRPAIDLCHDSATLLRRLRRHADGPLLARLDDLIARFDAAEHNLKRFSI